MKCDYCDAVATKVAYYGDEATVVGGGQARVAVCGRCIAPCNHPGDPHASFTHEEEIAT